eukprot:c16175_g1_i4.p1 GENE.c16175_g1_i4~~c16175_g1_i4.p1  ORF type:complete len:298 (+),score=61.21 c16175_g1_i4:47-940(+)
MDIKTLTGTVPAGRLTIFREIDKQLKLIDDEASNLRLDQQAEMEALKRENVGANKSSERKTILLSLLQEKCDMIKPILQQVIVNYGDELQPDHVQKLQDFLGFSLPPDEPERKEPSKFNQVYSSMDSALKKLLADGMDYASAIAARRQEANTEATEPVAGTRPAGLEGTVAQAEGEYPFTDEIDVTHEIDHWGASLKPQTKNFVSLVRDPANPDQTIPSGYKFHIDYSQLASGATPTYHIDLDDDYRPTIIRFHAGKPYHDLAYRISPRGWFTNTELGFRNTFQDGIFQLHFNLKKS